MKLIALILLLPTSFQGQSIYGVYTNSASTHRKFTNTLSLGCDYCSTFSFRGETFTDYYFGHWKRNSDTINFTIDSSNATVGIYKHSFKLYLQNGVLVEPEWNAAMVNTLKNFLDSVDKSKGQAKTFKISDLCPSTTTMKLLKKATKNTKYRKDIRDSELYKDPIRNSKKRFLRLTELYQCAL